MASIGKIKMRVPATIKRGDVVTIKSLILHPMKLPKRDKDGNAIGEGDYIDKVQVRYGGKVVASFEVGRGISANPFFAFRIKAAKAAPVTMVYTDIHGKTFKHQVDIKFS